MNKQKLRKQRKEILQLREMIPDFPPCEKGCVDCCGNVPWTEFEWSQVKTKKLAAVKTPLNCPYSDNGKCDVYEHRPILCRLYGNVEHEKMTCPRGIKPDKLMSRDLMRRIMVRYDKLIGGSIRERQETLRK